MNNKLKDSITATNKSIIDLYKKISSNSLILRPSFQRKLVWRKNHKFNFIKTILDNFPFPEIYISTGEINTLTMNETEIVVDGQQRLSTIRDYIDGIGDFENQKTITPFNKLDEADKKIFLSYKVIVRELGLIEEEVVKDIFQRINSTEYSLNQMEKINSSYNNNEFLIFSKKLLDHCYEGANSDLQIISCFFECNKIFSDNDIRRMIDLQFMMLIVISLEIGYFHRTSEINNFLEKYNESFPNGDKIQNELLNIINFINKLELDKKSYWLNKANIFTLIIELSKVELNTLNINTLKEKLSSLENIYKNESKENIEFLKYIEVAKEAVNDKKSRIRRGEFIQDIFKKCTN